MGVESSVEEDLNRGTYRRTTIATSLDNYIDRIRHGTDVRTPSYQVLQFYSCLSCGEIIYHRRYDEDVCL